MLDIGSISYKLNNRPHSLRYKGMIRSSAVELRRSCLRLRNFRSIYCGESGTMADSSQENAVHSQKGKDQEESIRTKIDAEDIEKIIVDKIGDPPEKPLPGDCCGSGCETCVWDIYFDDLKRYNDEKDALLKSLPPSDKMLYSCQGGLQCFGYGSRAYGKYRGYLQTV